MIISLSSNNFSGIKIKVIQIVCIFLFIQLCSGQSDDIYTFCGKGRARGDNNACLGFCESTSTTCSAETGICSCASANKRLRDLANNYNCKPARPRTRCHNACKTYGMITPRFRRGEVKICTSKRDSRKMCFCLPKV